MRLIRSLAIGSLAGGMLLTVEVAHAWDDELRESETFFGAEFASDQDFVQYELLIRTMLAEAFADNVRTRMVALPALSTEWVVGLRVREQGEWEVFVLKPTISARSYGVREDARKELVQKRASPGASATETREIEAQLRDIERGLPQDPRSVPIERCVVPLSDAVAARVQASWIATLRGAVKRDAPPFPYVRVIGDGWSYHFSQDGNPPLAAEVSNPEAEWPSGKLAALGTALRAYCQHPNRSTERQVLSAAASALPR